MDKVKRIKELTQQLNQYRDSYYNNSVSEISDQQYDNLFDELKKLEEETNIVMANSPTQTVGYEVKSKLEKVKHSHPMLSLDKTKSVDDIVKFLNGKKGIAMLKMDGLTCSLGYHNDLISGETRGNGEVGENILHNALTVTNIPARISTGTLVVDGEMIIDYKTFDEINKKLPETEKYKNPRNLASGSIRQLDSKIAACRSLKFIAWKCVEGISNNSFSERLTYLHNIGFDIVPHIVIEENASKNDIEYAISTLKDEAQLMEFPIDGIVFGYDDIQYGDSLGMTSHHVNSQIAYKFYDDIYPTRLLDVEFTMGKTGILTPTAIFEPVEIDGTVVERASLHNLSIMNEFGITHKGQIVNVYKANAIIPQIDSVEEDDIDITDDNMIIPAETCPICGSDTNIIKDNDTEVLVCSNPNCKGKLLGRLSHFCSKNAINIEGMSEATLQFLIDRGWVNSFKDIYKLDYYRESWKQYDGFGDKSVDKLLDNIEKSRNTTLDRFIYGLCIPLIGRTASKTIAKEFGMGNAEGFYDAWCYDYDFTVLNDFGDSMNASMQEFIKHNYIWISDLIEEFDFEQSSTSNKEKSLSEKIFVITGSLNHYKNRDELISVIEGLGGKVSGSVSAKTSYLINNDITSTSGKNKKANQLEIPIISEEGFIKMIS